MGGDGADTAGSADGSTLSCPATQSLCRVGALDLCVSPQTDVTNCGACGTACTAGACECPEGPTFCGGVCRDPRSDPRCCGALHLTCGTLLSRE